MEENLLEDAASEAAQALIPACTSGDLSAVEERLAGYTDMEPFQPLLAIAAHHGQHAIVLYLLARGLKIYPDALDAAVERGDPSLFQLFVDNGWDVNAPRGMFPGYLSLVCDDQTLLRWFFSHGADPNAPSPRGTTPFEQAGGRASIPVLDLFLQHGAIVRPSQVLHHAVQAAEFIPGRSEVIAFSLDRGADINSIESFKHPQLQRTARGTPLREAVINGDERMVRFLLKKGADPNVRDTRGLTALEVARDKRQTAIIPLLEHALVVNG